MRNVNRVSNSCKIGLKGYDCLGDLTYLGLFFMQNFLCKGCFFFFLYYVPRVVMPSCVIFLETFVFKRSYRLYLFRGEFIASLLV